MFLIFIINFHHYSKILTSKVLQIVVVYVLQVERIFDYSQELENILMIKKLNCNLNDYNLNDYNLN